MKLHKGQFDYICKDCGIPYQSSSALQYHIGRKHSEVPVESKFSRRIRKEEEMVALTRITLEKSDKLTLTLDESEASQMNSMLQMQETEVIPYIIPIISLPVLDAPLLLQFN